MNNRSGIELTFLLSSGESLFIKIEIESEKDLLSKGLRFAILPRQIDYSGYLAEYKLLYRSTTDLSVTEDREHFKAELKDIALSSYNF